MIRGLFVQHLKSYPNITPSVFQFLKYTISHLAMSSSHMFFPLSRTLPLSELHLANFYFCSHFLWEIIPNLKPGLYSPWYVVLQQTSFWPSATTLHTHGSVIHIRGAGNSSLLVKWVIKNKKNLSSRMTSMSWAAYPPWLTGQFQAILWEEIHFCLVLSTVIWGTLLQQLSLYINKCT